MFKAQVLDARALSSWFDERDSIDVDPIYQRAGGIWTKKDKALLIDSILNGYDIPKFYMADFTFINVLQNKKNKQYAVIDGRQRLEAIFEFFSGKLALDKEFQYLEDPKLNLGGLSYKDLTANYPRVARKFANFNIVVVGVITDDAPRINEMFVRLNRSKPLTGAEIRNAMSGIVPSQLHSIAEHKFFLKNISFGVRRAQGQNAAAKLLLVEFRGNLVETKKSGLDRFVTEATLMQNEDVKSSANRVRTNLSRMINIFIENDPLLRSQGPLTVYYWFCRSLKDNQTVKVREFLLNFENRRKQNREIAPKQQKRVDPELAAYDNYNRSTNDQGSLNGRFKILSRQFAEFCDNADR